EIVDISRVLLAGEDGPAAAVCLDHANLGNMVHHREKRNQLAVWRNAWAVRGGRAGQASPPPHAVDRSSQRLPEDPPNSADDKRSRCENPWERRAPRNRSSR